MTETGVVHTQTFDMSYCRFGSGEKTLLVLPGISLREVSGAGDALAQALSVFAGEYTVILLDRRRAMPEGYRIADSAEDTAAALAALKAEKIDIYAASTGCAIALELAVRHPSLVGRMALCAPVMPHRGYLQEMLSSWISLAARGTNRELAEGFFDAVYGDFFPSEQREAFAAACETLSAEERLQFSRDSQACLAWEGVSSCPVPVMVFGSMGDRVTGEEGAVALSDLLRCPRFLYGEKYSHAFFDEAPDCFARILRFLTGRDAPKAVLFDLDGTLIDTERIYGICWPKAVEQTGHFLSEERCLALRSLGKPFAPAQLREWFGEDFDYDEVRRIRNIFFREELEKSGVVQKPGAVKLLEFLHSRGIVTAVATATDLPRANEYLKAAGLDGYFSQVISAKNVPCGKPAPDVYLHACSVLGFSPADCLAVEDAPNGVRSAYSAGLRAVMIPDRSEPDAELSRLLTACLRRLDELCDAFFPPK